MRVLLDDQPCDTGATSIGEAIARAANLAEARGRVVVEVVVDGAVWSQAELDREDLQAGPAGEVCMSSADLRELVVQTLDDAAAALGAADAKQREAAELLQTNQHAAALAQLGDALEIWAEVREAVVKSARATNIDLGALTVGATTMGRLIERLGDHLRALRDALQSSDPVELADTLLYDMPDVVGEWREALMAMQAHVEEDH